MRRYYHRGQWQYSSTMEVRLKRVPIIVVLTDKLSSTEVTAENFAVKYVQVRKSNTYSDLRKRICDCLGHL